MATLCVNIDHVATLRQARRGVEPEPVHAAGVVEMAGSTGVTVHLREDERHIGQRDVRLIREVVQGHLNLEMAATETIVCKALEIRPDIATLVPEKRREVTTEGGLDVVKGRRQIRETIKRLHEAEIAVSLFIDPHIAQIEAAIDCGARQIELHTGQYCLARGENQLKQLETLDQAGRRARELGLLLHAGHGLNYHNVQPVAAIPGMRELNIGHAIISRSVFVGLHVAVCEMRRLIDEATRSPQAYRLDPDAP